MKKPLVQDFPIEHVPAGNSSDTIASTFPRDKQINALTSTRAIAAILVFIHHFGPGNIFPPFARIGNVAVCYFFVLSGFVLYLSYQGKHVRYSDYLKKRIGRIVPVYLLALLITVSLAVVFFGNNLSSARSIKELVLSAFFLQAFVPTYPLTLNLPGWTISVEMFFYLLFPLLLTVQRKNIKYFAVMAAVLFIASQYIHLKYFPIRKTLGDNIVDTVFFSPWIHLSQFLLGMIAGYIFNRIKGIAPKYKFLPLALFIAIILFIAYRTYRPENLSFQVGLLDPLFMLLILSIAINDPKILNIRPLVYLGEISYGIYILQWPVYQFLELMNERHMHIPMPYFFSCALIILVLFASLSYHLMELPLKRKISSIKI